MRVARIITRLNIGGPSIQAITLSERLIDRGFDTLLVHGQLGAGEGDMRYLLADPRARVESLPSLRRPVDPLHDAAAFWQIYRLLRAFRPDIVHTHMAKAGTIGRAAALAYNRTVGAGRRARLVHTYHGHVLEGYFDARTTQVYLAVERALARGTDAIVAISPRIGDELVDRYGIGRREQYRIVPLGFDLAPFAAVDDAARARARKTLDVPDGVPVITTAGRLTAIKQYDFLLDVARQVVDRRSDALFLIAGDGELRDELEARMRMLRLTRHVRFLGWRRDLSTVYAASELFALTSRNEGTPVALIESMATAVPGISTDVGGVRDVINSDDIGVVIAPGDAGGMAAAMLALIDDAPRRRAMGERARQSVVMRYGLDRLVADVDALYRSLRSRP